MLGDVWAMWGDVWAMLGDVWAMLGNVGRCWSMLGDVGRCVGDVGRCVVDVGRCLGGVGRCLGDVGRCLGDVGRCLGDVWAMFGRCLGDVGRCLGNVGRCWAVLGDVWRCVAVGGMRGTVESVLPLGAATLLRLVGRLCALRYDGQGRRKDAAGETDVAESCPMLWVDELAEGRGVGPGDVFAGVGDGGGLELYALQVFDDAVGCGAVSVPDGPPAAGLFREVLVGGWLAEEVAVVGSRCRGFVVEVNLDCGEPGSECSLEPVGDEEEFVGGGEDGFMEGGGVGLAGDEI
eukprot:scaffold1856_cov96-Amphora_coffeaeformis.AAC.1